MPLRISSWVVIHLLETIYYGLPATFKQWRENATVADYAAALFIPLLMGLVIFMLAQW